MPSSKEIRARQQRQKERIAAQHAERLRTRERRRRIGAMVIVIVVVAGVALGFVFGPNHSDNKANDKVANVPTTPFVTAPSTTAAPLASVKGKPCVGLKNALPKGSPSFTVPTGAAPTELEKTDLKVGTGAVIPENAKVTVNYVGVACSTGKIFDSTYAHNQPFEADLSAQLITGWKQGVPGMRIGGLRLLSIPADLGYGAQGSPPAIAPDEALFFLIAPVKLG